MTDFVSREFDSGAARYDLLVGLNPGYHRHLRTAARELVSRAGARGARFADLGCGSGASTRALVAEAPDSTVLGVDASEGMLERARAKSWPPLVGFLHGRAGELSRQVSGLDGILACYLFRNVPVEDRDAALRDAYDALAEGGWLVAEDYSVAHSLPTRVVWTLVCWLVILPLSVLTGGNPRLYSYLWRNVLANESPQSLMRRMAAAGFTDLATRTVDGWQRGILHLVVGRRP